MNTKVKTSKSSSSKKLQPVKSSKGRTQVPYITRHRPKRLKDLIGMDSVVKKLTVAITQGNIPNAFLIIGTTGCGKTTLSRIIARTVMCETRDACGKCESCLACDSNMDAHPDYSEINCGEEGKIDDIRGTIAMARNSPVLGAMRVVLLDEVHRLSGASAEAILKPLEEPAERTLFILATTESNNIKETVKNRCSTIRVKPLSPEVLGEYLAEISRHDVEENIVMEDWAELTEEIAQMSGGVIRQALGYLDSVLNHYRATGSSDLKNFLEEVRSEILENTEEDVLAAQKILLHILFGNPKGIINILANHSEFFPLSRNLVNISQYLLDYMYEAKGSNVYHIPTFRSVAQTMTKVFEERGVNTRNKRKALTSLSIGITELHAKMAMFSVPERALISAHTLKLLDDISIYTAKKSQKD